MEELNDRIVNAIYDVVTNHLYSDRIKKDYSASAIRIPQMVWDYVMFQLDGILFTITRGPFRYTLYYDHPVMQDKIAGGQKVKEIYKAVKGLERFEKFNAKVDKMVDTLKTFEKNDKA